MRRWLERMIPPGSRVRVITGRWNGRYGYLTDWHWNPGGVRQQAQVYPEVYLPAEGRRKGRQVRVLTVIKVEPSDVWHSTGSRSEDGHKETECPGFDCPVVKLRSGDCGECYLPEQFAWEYRGDLDAEAPVIVCTKHGSLAPDWLYTSNVRVETDPISGPS